MLNQLRRPRPRPSLAGLRAGGRHEHRELTARVLSVLRLAGRDDPSLAGVLAVGAWMALTTVTFLGLTAPALREVLPPGGLTSAVPAGLVVAAALAVAVVRKHAATLRAQHAALLHVVGPATGAGLRLGLSISLVPLIVVTVSQCLRHGSLPATLAAVAVVGAAALVVLPRRVPGRAGRAEHLVLLVCALLLVSAGAMQLSHDLPALVRAADGLGVPMGSAVAGLLVAAASGLFSALAARHLAMHRLGPRASSARRSAAWTVTVLLGLGWCAALAVAPSERFGVLAEHAVLLGPVLATLLLRARHVRFVSPEALGHGLLLARDGGLDARRLLTHYRRNTLTLLMPAYAGGSLLLVLAGSAATVPLLWALLVLEVTADSIIVQRTTALVAVQDLPRLVTHSRSGLAAAVCLGVVFTAAGAAGLFPVFAFSHHAVETALASGLLVLAGSVVLALTHADAPDWLRDVRALHR